MLTVESLDNSQPLEKGLQNNLTGRITWTNRLIEVRLDLAYDKMF